MLDEYDFSKGIRGKYVKRLAAGSNKAMSSLPFKPGAGKLLAACLLKVKRKLSYSQIEALPMVRTQSDVEEIIEYLVRTMNAEKNVEKRADYPILRWETILTI